ncbi:hypothetical protein EBZ37_10655, partial [bacterium]|nr:hypothetical protein [bacterium]
MVNEYKEDTLEVRRKELQDLATLMQVLRDKSYSEVVEFLKSMKGMRSLIYLIKDYRPGHEVIERTLGYEKNSMYGKSARQKFSGGKFPPPAESRSEKLEITFGTEEGRADEERDEWLRILVHFAGLFLKEGGKKASKEGPLQTQKAVSEFLWKIRGANEVIRQADADSGLFEELCKLLQTDPFEFRRGPAREKFLAWGSPQVLKGTKRALVEEPEPVKKKRRRTKADQAKDSEGQEPEPVKKKRRGT